MHHEDMNSGNLAELINSPSVQWVLVGGKGGVGKTTTACSLAVLFAQRRDKVLIVSTDPAHNLCDAFEQKFSNVPQLVNGFDNLFAMESDAKFEEDSIMRLTPDTSWLSMAPQLMKMLPGMDEVGAFATIIDLATQMRFSCVILDTAPTGHTLRLLGLPATLKSTLDTLKQYQDSLSAAFSLMSSMSGKGLNQSELTDKIARLQAANDLVLSMLTDPSKATFVCVCIPEFLAVYETERLVQALAQQHIDCSHIVVNQVLPPIEVPPGTPLLEHDLDLTTETAKHLLKENTLLRQTLLPFKAYYDSRRNFQRKYLAQIDTLYGDLFNVVLVQQQTDEIRGTTQLREHARRLGAEGPWSAPPSPVEAHQIVPTP